MAKQQVLLLKDVGQERAGEIVDVKSGFARNYLYPQGFAVKASAHTIRMQEALREERRKQAAVDRAESEKAAAAVQGKTVETEVKVDPEGRLYGSVSAADVAALLSSTHGVEVTRKAVQLPQPLKKLGEHQVTISFPEGVTCEINVVVNPEGGYPEAVAADEESAGEESAEEAASEEAEQTAEATEAE